MPLTRLRVEDLVEAVRAFKAKSDDYHRAKDDPLLSLDELTAAFFRVEFGTAVSDRRLRAFRRGVWAYMGTSMMVRDFAVALGWDREAPAGPAAAAGAADGDEVGRNNAQAAPPPAGGVNMPLPFFRAGDAKFLKVEAQRWLGQGRLLLQQQLAACEAEIASLTAAGLEEEAATEGV